MASRARRLQLLRNLERKYGLPRGLLYGVWGAESNFAEHGGSTSGKGAQGPFQFMPETAASMGVNPQNFASSAKGAARYLARGGKTVDLKLASYNAGPGAVAQYGGVPPYAETRAYIGRVKDYMKQAPYAVGSAPGGAPERKSDRDPVSVRAARIANAPTTTKHTDYTPSRTVVDRRAAIVDALLSNDPSSAASGRLPASGGLLSDVQRRIASGAYTTVTPESTRVTTIKERAAAKAARGAPPPAKGESQGRVNAKLKGGGYHGTEALVKQVVDPIAGIKASNYKRTPEHNASIGGSPTSDHLTTNTRSYAADYGTTNGEPIARRIAKGLGIKNYTTGNYNHYIVKIGGRRFRVQILWAVPGHHDHVHFGAYALD